MILRAYKTELDPTAEQRRALARHVAGARMAYNFALERWHALAGLTRLVSFLRVCVGFDDKHAASAFWLGASLHALCFGERIETRRPKRKKDENGATEYAVSVRFRIAPLKGSSPDLDPNSDWIHAQLTREKNVEDGSLHWLTELSAFAPREGVGDVGRAYDAFFRRLRKHAAGDHSECKPRRTGGCNLGEPHFRSGLVSRSYHVDQPNPIRTTDRAVLIPKIRWVRLKERGYLPVTHADSHSFVGGGKVCGLGISQKDGRWYVALRCEVPNPIPQARGPGRALRDRPVPRIPGRRMGVENGVRVLAVGYDGDSSDVIAEEGLRDDVRIGKFEMIRRRWERRMVRRWQDGVPRRDQSKGWWEARTRVAHYHARIVHLRDDRVGKVVRKIVDRGAETVLLRAPHVAKLLNRETAPDAAARNRLAPDVHGARMGDLRERLEYKQLWAGGKVELVDVFEPVTKRCSMCGAIRATSPGYPTFVCDKCGHSEDRDDANAPRNLQNYSGSSSSGAASPRSAGPKPPQGNNGRGNQMARASAQAQVTAPEGGVTSALGPDNRDLPGAPCSARSNAVLQRIENERCGDDDHGSPQFGGDTAQPEAEDQDRSQTVSQVRDSSRVLRGGSESIR